MTKKQQQAYRRLIDETTGDVLLTVWQAAMSQCDEIYKAMLIRLRDEIDKQKNQRAMNYYIKGEHPVEWVRAKLRELGVKEINIPVSITGTGKWFYCVVGDDYELICSDAVKATIMASPDWEEVKPTEPKFKVGDIVQYDGGFFQVTKVKCKDGEFTYCIGNGWYYLEDSLTRPDNPSVRYKVKEAFNILNNKPCDIGAR